MSAKAAPVYDSGGRSAVVPAGFNAPRRQPVGSRNRCHSPDWHPEIAPSAELTLSDPGSIAIASSHADCWSAVALPQAVKLLRRPSYSTVVVKVLMSCLLSVGLIQIRPSRQDIEMSSQGSPRFSTPAGGHPVFLLASMRDGLSSAMLGRNEVRV